MKIVKMRMAVALVIALAMGAGCQTAAGTAGDAENQAPVQSAGSRKGIVGDAERQAPVQSAPPASNSAFSTDSFNARTASLASQLSGYKQNYDTSVHTVAITTFVDLGHLNGGSFFGRQVSERLSHTLQTAGYRVFELRMGKNVGVVENSGEFVLTRKLDGLAAPYKPDAVVVGTYQMVGSVVTVHARLLDADTARVISVATADFRTDDDPYTAALLNKDEEAAMDGELSPITLGIRELMAEETDVAPKTLALKMDQLIRDITRDITPGKLGHSVTVASFVDMDKLNRTNSFGRFLTEGVMDRMAHRGYTVVETRTARELMTQTNVGEQALSREPEEMKGGAAADAVVLGTYTMSGDTLLVHARLVRPESRQVAAAGMFQMNVRPGDPFIKRMFEEPFERVGENNYSEGKRKK